MKKRTLTLLLSMTLLLGIAMPVHAKETVGYVKDANGTTLSLTPPQTEEEKTDFGWALMAEGTLRQYVDAKNNGRYFDPEYYAANNPDVVEAFGEEPWVFYYHYARYGGRENRVPYEGATPGVHVNWDLCYTEVVIKMLARQDGISEEEEWKKEYNGNIPWYATTAGIEAEIQRRNGGI